MAKFFGLNRKVPSWWENGTFRPSITQLRALGVSNRVISKAINFGLEGSKKNMKLPTKVCFDEMFAWFLGLRRGDVDETCSDVGVGSSRPEIIQKCIGFFRKFNIDESQLWLYVRTINAKMNKTGKKWSTEIGIPPCRIRVYPAVSENEDYANLRLSCLLFRMLIDKIDKNVDLLLENSPLSVKAAYAQGFLDAEGCVEDVGIRVNQKATKDGTKNIKRLYWLLGELGIKCGKFIMRDGVLSTYAYPRFGKLPI